MLLERESWSGSSGFAPSENSRNVSRKGTSHSTITPLALLPSSCPQPPGQQSSHGRMEDMSGMIVPMHK